MKRPTMDSIHVNFVGLYESEEKDAGLLDSLLLRALKRAFAIGKVQTVLLEGDDNAERLFRGLAPISQEDGHVECEVSRGRFESFLPS